MRTYLRILTLFLFLFLISAADFYSILGVSRSATKQDIKKAFKVKSKEYHPDKNKDPSAADHYARILKAYEILSDDNLKSIYDGYGEEGLRRFEENTMNKREKVLPKTQPIVVDLQVTLNQLFTGDVAKVRYNHYKVCDHCHGSGAFSLNHVHTCDVCHGSGVVIETRKLGFNFVTQMQTTCSKCQGSGEIITKHCNHCGGRGMHFVLDEVSVRIPDHSSYGENVIVHGVGHSAAGYETGDLIVRLIPSKSIGNFRRENNDVIYSMEINLADALIGFEKEIRHLDGRKFMVKSSNIISPFERKTISGEGFKSYGVVGDLVIEYNIQFPKKLTKEQKNTLKSILK